MVRWTTHNPSERSYVSHALVVYRLLPVPTIYCWAVWRQLHKLGASHGGWCPKIHHTPPQLERRTVAAGQPIEARRPIGAERWRIPFGSDGLCSSDSDGLVSQQRATGGVSVWRQANHVCGRSQSESGALWRRDVVLTSTPVHIHAHQLPFNWRCSY